MNQEDKNKFMQLAIDEAYKGIRNNDGGPFGTVIVKDNKVVGIGHNMVLRNNDSTCHGEIMAIKDACNNLHTYDLSGCVLFTSSEPCPMCKGAIQWARIKKVYQGCNVNDAANIGFDDKKFYDTTLQSEEVNRKDCLKLFDDYKKLNNKKY